MAFLKKLKKKTRDLRSQAQRQAQPATSMGNKFDRMFGMSRQSPRPNFFSGGLGGSIFERLIRNNPKFRGIQRMPMPPAIPNNMMAEPSLPMNFMPENMPMERFPMMRPQFAAGEEVDMNMIIAEQGARESISPAEMATQRIKQFLADSGRTVSNRDAELFGMGVLTLEDIMKKAGPVTNRNLMQQEQMFFPDSGRTISNMDMNSLDDILEDLEKKN